MEVVNVIRPVSCAKASSYLAPMAEYIEGKSLGSDGILEDIVEVGWES